MLLGPIECFLRMATSPKLGNVTNVFNIYKETQKTGQNETEEYVPNEGTRHNLRKRTK